MFCELQWRWNKFESKLCPLPSFTISEKWQHRSNCKDIFFTLPTRLSWRFEAKIKTSIWLFVRHCYWIEIVRFVIIANLSMSSLTEAHHLWQEYIIWSRAQGLPDSKNKISVPLWLLSLLNRLTGKSEQTPELNWQQPLFKGGQCICLRPRISAGSSWGFPLASCQVTTWYFRCQLLTLQYKCTVGAFFVNSLLTIIVSGQRTRWWSCSPAREQIQGWERHSWTPLKIIKLELFLFHLDETA